MKFREQEVIEAVKRVLEENQSIQESAKLIGMSKSNLQEYVYRAREHGYSCLNKSNQNRHYDGAFKVHVVEYARKNNLSNNAASAHFNLAKSVVKRWERIYLEEGAEALFQERRGRKTLSEKKRGHPPKLDKQVKEDLIAENQRLRMENEFLKKLNALVLEREKHENKK